MMFLPSPLTAVLIVPYIVDKTSGFYLIGYRPVSCDEASRRGVLQLNGRTHPELTHCRSLFG